MMRRLACALFVAAVAAASGRGFLALAECDAGFSAWVPLVQIVDAEQLPDRDAHGEYRGRPAPLLVDYSKPRAQFMTASRIFDIERLRKYFCATSISGGCEAGTSFINTNGVYQFGVARQRQGPAAGSAGARDAHHEQEEKKKEQREAAPGAAGGPRSGRGALSPTTLTDPRSRSQAAADDASAGHGGGAAHGKDSTKRASKRGRGTASCTFAPSEQPSCKRPRFDPDDAIDVDIDSGKDVSCGSDSCDIVNVLTCSGDEDLEAAGAGREAADDQEDSNGVQIIYIGKATRKAQPAPGRSPDTRRSMVDLDRGLLLRLSDHVECTPAADPDAEPAEDGAGTAKSKKSRIRDTGKLVKAVEKYAKVIKATGGRDSEYYGACIMYRVKYCNDLVRQTDSVAEEHKLLLEFRRASGMLPELNWNAGELPPSEATRSLELNTAHNVHELPALGRLQHYSSNPIGNDQFEDFAGNGVPLCPQLQLKRIEVVADDEA